MPLTDPFLALLHEWAEITMRRSMRNVMRHTKESGLSMSQMGTLFYLQRCGHSGVSGLGGHLGITNAAASQKNLRPAKSSNKPAASERITEIQSMCASNQGMI